jgi:hypothetical protein
MSLQLYAVKRDHFVAEESGRGFNFPCNACVNRHQGWRDVPCRYCDHNDSADSPSKAHGAEGEPK